MKGFKAYITINEVSKKTMNYKSTEGNIEVTYEVRKENVHFSLINKEDIKVDLVTSTYKDVLSPEEAIFNWLKSINY